MPPPRARPLPANDASHIAAHRRFAGIEERRRGAPVPWNGQKVIRSGDACLLLVR